MSNNDSSQLKASSGLHPPETLERHSTLSNRSDADSDELLKRLSKVAEANPDDPETRRLEYHALKRLLERNAYLGYCSESEKLYNVRTGIGLDVNVIKDRNVVPPYPPREASPLHSPSRWLAAAFLGLFLAGVPTLICSPISILVTLDALINRPLSRADKGRALTFILTAVALFAVGALFSAFLIIHIID
jgi:hypothetical protein